MGDVIVAEGESKHSIHHLGLSKGNYCSTIEMRPTRVAFEHISICEPG
jgi:hypothetical protein